jgi:ribosome-binding protein aMBF1 (putative translation factor)
LGIAQRQIHTEFSQKQGRKNRHNPLPINIETVGDWIKVKRIQKNLTSGHVAAKMGIAQSVVRSWERGASQPDKWQLEVLRDIFGFDPKTEPTLIDIIFPSD